MAPLPVQLKHAGKVYNVQLDPDLSPTVFKDAIYQVTGVPVDRMKVMIKGGVLKDDTLWKKVAPKAGQIFTVIGTAGELPKPPEKPIVFLEDMDDSELAEALARPVGLRNLGNTCYMNASIQALRAIPELQVALSVPALQSTTPLPAALRDLYLSMSRTSATVTPMSFLTTLRQVNPQFAELDRREKGMGPMAGYAQQDAEECFGQIITTLRNVPGISPGASIPSESEEVEAATANTKKFVEQYLMGQMRRELTCDEAPDEAPSVTHENVLKIECNINITTNYMLTGITNSLTQKVEKRSPSLGREAIYSQRSRMTRLPGYLVVHMVRFAWRHDIGKKAKIMRKVKFPLEFDALDLATDELKAKLLPVSRKLKEVESERVERRKVRRKTKAAAGAVATPFSAASMAPTTVTTVDVEMGDVAAVVGVDDPTGEATLEKGKEVAGQELEDESVYRERELEELGALINEDVKNDIGASVSGLYDLVSIVTHKGAAADAGHYIGFVKKSVFHGSSATPGLDDDDEDWYKFDDEKVSVFPKEKLATLDGGGEDSSAYLLVYKSKTL